MAEKYNLNTDITQDMGLGQMKIMDNGKGAAQLTTMAILKFVLLDIAALISLDIMSKSRF